MRSPIEACDVIQILLVEDNVDDASLVCQELRKTAVAAQYSIISVATLKEALTELDQKHFDLVLLDLKLPDSSGLETFQALHKAAPHLAIIILTGMEDDNLGLAAVKAGARDYLVKGVDPRPLTYAVERWHFAARTAKYAQEQAAIASLSRQILAGANLQDIYKEAVEGVTLTLSVEVCQLFQCATGEERGGILASVGWDFTRNAPAPGLVVLGEAGAPYIPHVDTHLIPTPQGDRLPGPSSDLLRDRFFVPIQINLQAWGYLAVYTCKSRSFSPHESHFLNTIAHLLGEITQRKRAETAIADNEAHTRAIVESSMDAIIMIDREDRVIQFNAAAEAMFGYARKMVIGQKMADRIIPARFRQRHITGLEQIAREGAAPFLGRRMEVTALNAVGKEFPVEMTVVAVKGLSNQYFIASIRDITELREATKALEVAQRQQHLILESVGEGIHGLDVEGKVVFQNKTAQALLGFEKDDLVGKQAHQLIHHHTQQGAHYPWDQCPMYHTLRDGVFRKVEGEVFFRKDGSSFPVEYSCAPLRNEHGKIIGVVAGFRDISERKRTEEALRASQENMAEAQRIAHFGSWEIQFSEDDLSGGILTWSDEMYRIAGLEPGSVELTRKFFYEIVPAEDRPAMDQAIETALTGGKPYELVHGLVRPTGEVRIVHERAQIFLDPQTGRPRRVVGTTHDVTEQRLAEEALALQAHMLDQIGQAVISTDLNGKVLYANRAAGEMYGWAPAEAIGKNFLDLNVAEPHQQAATEIMDKVRSGESWHGEFMVKHSNGRIFPAWVTTSPLKDRHGHLSGIVGISSDISERKKAEAELTENQSLLRVSSRVGKLGAWRVDVPEMHLTMSEEARQIYEVKVDDIPNLQSVINFYSPNYQDRIQQAFGECVANGTPFDEEFEIITAKGNPKWVRSIGEAVKDETGAIIRIQGAIQDIAEKKEIDEKVKKTAETLTTLLKSITDAFFTLDREWRFTYMNPEAERLLGLETRQVIGKDMWEVFPEARGTLFEKQYRWAVAENKSTAFEEYYPPFQMWFSVRAYPSPDGLAVYFLDITEKKRSEEAMKLSEERFQVVSKATNDVVWDWDITNNKIWWNDNFQSLFGYSPQDISYERWAALIHTEDREKILQDVAKAQQESRASWSGEYRFKRKDGLYAWVLDRRYFIRSDHGKAIRMIGSISDLTERREAEERIAEQAALLDIAPEAILVKQLDDRIIYWNKGAERIYGWTAQEAVGRKSSELLAMDISQYQDAFGVLLEKGEWQGEFTKKARDGRTLQIQARWTFVRDENGKPKSLLAINTDITDKKLLESQFLRAQRLESIGTLAGGIAHDLNNVLAPIIMSLEMLEDEVKGEEGKALLSTLQKSAHRGADLVKQVLSFARGMEGRSVPVNPVHVAREIQKIIRDTFPKNIEFKLKVTSELWTVTGDPTQIHQVLMNLCVNSRDAMPAGGQLVLDLENVELDEVYAGLTPEAKPGNYVLLSVTDTGTGIPASLRDKIFEPFFTTKDVGRGTGLGLSTTVAIVKSHGGFIHLYSELGKGTTFKIYLPATLEDAAREQGATGHQKLPKGHGELILLIDDEDAVRTIAQKTLERFGYQVLLAANGAEGVGIYAQQKSAIALVLTDMAMPIMDGPATIVALKAMNPNVRIVGCSGVASNAGVTKAMGAGVMHFVPKPYTAETLLNTLYAALRE